MKKARKYLVIIAFVVVAAGIICGILLLGNRRGRGEEENSAVYEEITMVLPTYGYVPEHIDAINSDLDVAMLIYGPGDLNPENPNWPACYICAGSEDDKGFEGHVGAATGSQMMYDSIKDTVPALVNVIEGAGHGFGVGQEGATKSVPACAEWPAQADAFMQENRGYSQKGSNPAEEEAGSLADSDAFAGIFEEYTQTKVFEGTYGFGDAEITAYTNDDLTAFYLIWEAFDEDQVLEGTVDDGIVDVTYDETGFMTGDAQLIWDDAVASANEWIAR